jgi:hypothetical protein
MKTAMKMRCVLAAGAALLIGALPAAGYPLDASERTGILRLKAYDLAQTGRVRGRLLPPGGRLATETIRLRLADQPGFRIPEPDAAFTAAIAAVLGSDADGYAIAVLDLTDPARPRLAAHNANREQNPASVGKLMAGLAWFQALADIYPGDDAARHALMRDTVVRAGPFARGDSHKVPFWSPGDSAIDSRPIRDGDSGNLWTWLDWMMSSSSNAAASTLMAEAIMLRHYGKEYPVAHATAQAFLNKTPSSDLSKKFRATLDKPVTRNGLDVGKLRQGGFFTRSAKNRIPGTVSVSTPMELLRFIVKLEQGQLVDEYSSLELKRLLYLSERRIRYASTLALRRAALYFKSGSLYNCRAETGFQCGKYRGNVRNFLNSVTVVETDEPGRELHYVAVVLSNVLRKDSAQIHKALATEIHRILESDHRVGATPTESLWPETPPADAGAVEEMNSDDDAPSADPASGSPDPN